MWRCGARWGKKRPDRWRGHPQGRAWTLAEARAFQDHIIDPSRGVSTDWTRRGKNGKTYPFRNASKVICNIFAIFRGVLYVWPNEYGAIVRTTI